MKIALVGKGGSGKSSTSWLLTKTLENLTIKTLAIDADHNMDLTSNLGLDPEVTPKMFETEKAFIKLLGNEDAQSASSILTLPQHTLPSFTTSPADSYTASISTKISENLSLINVGLGSPDVMFSGKCAHGLSGPLKYYLGLLNEGDGFVVIDSVAGADMLNYGLYAGIDAVIGVVEPHRNSVKVFEQIQNICRKSLIPCYAIINKPTNNEFYTSFKERYGTIILGEIPLDAGVMNYAYPSLTQETKEGAIAIIDAVKNLKKRGNLNTIKDFQEMKKSK